MPKTQLIDKIPGNQAFLFAVGYFVLMFIFLIVGAGGPSPYDFSLPVPLAGSKLKCTNPADCVLTYRGVFSGISSYNQNIWMAASLYRPNDTSTGKPAMLNSVIQWTQLAEVDIIGYNGAVPTAIYSNVTQIGNIRCFPGQTICGGMLLFNQAFLTYDAYEITARFLQPYSAFLEAGLSAQQLGSDSEVLALRSGFVKPAFTAFQVGAKAFFFAASVVMFSIYNYFMIRGRGTIDPRGPNAARDAYEVPQTAIGKLFTRFFCCVCSQRPGRLRSSWLQTWTWWLSLGLIFFNEPMFVISLQSPNLAYAGWYAVCAVTFLCGLLMFWLVSFDRARHTPEEAALAGSLPSAFGSVSDRLGRSVGIGEQVAKAMCFWIPKVILIVAIWITVLSVYMWQRYMQIEDPGYSVFKEFPSASKYFYDFAIAMIAIYLVYLLVLMCMGFGPRTCPSMKSSDRFVVSVTICSILIIVIAFFALGVSAALRDTAMLMALYGVANAYLWYMMIITLPCMPADMSDLMIDDAARKAALEHKQLTNGGNGGLAKQTVEMGVQADGGPNDGAYYGNGYTNAVSSSDMNNSSGLDFGAASGSNYGNFSDDSGVVSSSSSSSSAAAYGAEFQVAEPTFSGSFFQSSSNANGAVAVSSGSSSSNDVALDFPNEQIAPATTTTSTTTTANVSSARSNKKKKAAGKPVRGFPTNFGGAGDDEAGNDDSNGTMAMPGAATAAASSNNNTTNLDSADDFFSQGPGPVDNSEAIVIAAPSAPVSASKQQDNVMDEWL